MLFNTLTNISAVMHSNKWQDWYFSHPIIMVQWIAHVVLSGITNKNETLPFTEWKNTYATTSSGYVQLNGLFSGNSSSFYTRTPAPRTFFWRLNSLLGYDGAPKTNSWLGQKSAPMVYKQSQLCTSGYWFGLRFETLSFIKCAIYSSALYLNTKTIWWKKKAWICGSKICKVPFFLCPYMHDFCNQKCHQKTPCLTDRWN